MAGRHLRQQGFTLIEVVMVGSIMAILAALAAPAMGQLLSTHRMQSTTHLLTADFAAARMAAISRNVPVVACPSDGVQCIAGGNWSDGWIVFADPRRANQPASAEALIVHRQARNDGLAIHSSQGRPRLRYLPNGMSGGSNLTVSVCEAGVLKSRVVVNNAGRIRSERARTATPCPQRS